MAIRSREELLDSLRIRMGDDVSDETITLIEDFNDTFSDYERRLNDSGDWERRYQEMDESWRRRYRDRFFERDTEENFGEYEERRDSAMEFREKEEKELSYEDLFKED